MNIKQDSMFTPNNPLKVTKSLYAHKFKIYNIKNGE